MWDLMRYADNIAFMDECGKSVTYQDLNTFSTAIGNVIKNKCVVVILCDNSLPSVPYPLFYDIQPEYSSPSLSVYNIHHI